MVCEIIYLVWYFFNITMLLVYGSMSATIGDKPPKVIKWNFAAETMKFFLHLIMLMLLGFLHISLLFQATILCVMLIELIEAHVKDGKEMKHPLDWKNLIARRLCWLGILFAGGIFT